MRGHPVCWKAEGVTTALLEKSLGKGKEGECGGKPSADWGDVPVIFHSTGVTSMLGSHVCCAFLPRYIQFTYKEIQENDS